MTSKEANDYGECFEGQTSLRLNQMICMIINLLKIVSSMEKDYLSMRLRLYGTSIVFGVNTIQALVDYVSSLGDLKTLADFSKSIISAKSGPYEEIKVIKKIRKLILPLIRSSFEPKSFTSLVIPVVKINIEPFIFKSVDNLFFPAMNIIGTRNRQSLEKAIQTLEKFFSDDHLKSWGVPAITEKLFYLFTNFLEPGGASINKQIIDVLIKIVQMSNSSDLLIQLYITYFQKSVDEADFNDAPLLQALDGAIEHENNFSSLLFYPLSNVMNIPSLRDTEYMKPLRLDHMIPRRIAAHHGFIYIATNNGVLMKIGTGKCGTSFGSVELKVNIGNDVPINLVVFRGKIYLQTQASKDLLVYSFNLEYLGTHRLITAGVLVADEDRVFTVNQNGLCELNEEFEVVEMTEVQNFLEESHLMYAHGYIAGDQILLFLPTFPTVSLKIIAIRDPESAVVRSVPAYMSPCIALDYVANICIEAPFWGLMQIHFISPSLVHMSELSRIQCPTGFPTNILYKQTKIAANYFTRKSFKSSLPFRICSPKGMQELLKFLCEAPHLPCQDHDLIYLLSATILTMYPVEFEIEGNMLLHLVTNEKQKSRWFFMFIDSVLQTKTLLNDYQIAKQFLREFTKEEITQMLSGGFYENYGLLRAILTDNFECFHSERFVFSCVEALANAVLIDELIHPSYFLPLFQSICTFDVVSIPMMIRPFLPFFDSFLSNLKTLFASAPIFEDFVEKFSKLDLISDLQEFTEIHDSARGQFQEKQLISVYESHHPFCSRIDEHIKVCFQGANQYIITFDERCKLNASDYIEFLSTQRGYKVRIGGVYKEGFGTNAKPLLIHAPKFEIHVLSRGRGNSWGYKITVQGKLYLTTQFCSPSPFFDTMNAVYAAYLKSAKFRLQKSQKDNPIHSPELIEAKMSNPLYDSSTRQKVNIILSKKLSLEPNQFHQLIEDAICYPPLIQMTDFEPVKMINSLAITLLSVDIDYPSSKTDFLLVALKDTQIAVTKSAELFEKIGDILSRPEPQKQIQALLNLFRCVLILQQSSDSITHILTEILTVFCSCSFDIESPFYIQILDLFVQVFQLLQPEVIKEDLVTDIATQFDTPSFAYFSLVLIPIFNTSSYTNCVFTQALKVESFYLTKFMMNLFHSFKINLQNPDFLHILSMIGRNLKSNHYFSFSHAYIIRKCLTIPFIKELLDLLGEDQFVNEAIFLILGFRFCPFFETEIVYLKQTKQMCQIVNLNPVSYLLELADGTHLVLPVFDSETQILRDVPFEHLPIEHLPKIEHPNLSILTNLPRTPFRDFAITELVLNNSLTYSTKYEVLQEINGEPIWFVRENIVRKSKYLCHYIQQSRYPYHSFVCKFKIGDCFGFVPYDCQNLDEAVLFDVNDNTLVYQYTKVEFTTQECVIGYYGPMKQVFIAFPDKIFLPSILLTDMDRPIPCICSFDPDQNVITGEQATFSVPSFLLSDSLASKSFTHFYSMEDNSIQLLTESFDCTSFCLLPVLHQTAPSFYFEFKVECVSMKLAVHPSNAFDIDYSSINKVRIAFDDVYGCLFNPKDATLALFKNGSLCGKTASSNLAFPSSISACFENSTNVSFNFGHAPFTYDPSTYTFDNESKEVCLDCPLPFDVKLCSELYRVSKGNKPIEEPVFIRSLESNQFLPGIVSGETMTIFGFNKGFSIVPTGNNMYIHCSTFLRLSPPRRFTNLRNSLTLEFINNSPTIETCNTIIDNTQRIKDNLRYLEASSHIHRFFLEEEKLEHLILIGEDCNLDLVFSFLDKELIERAADVAIKALLSTPEPEVVVFAKDSINEIHREGASYLGLRIEKPTRGFVASPKDCRFYSSFTEGSTFTVKGSDIVFKFSTRKDCEFAYLYTFNKDTPALFALDFAKHVILSDLDAVYIHRLVLFPIVKHLCKSEIIFANELSGLVLLAVQRKLFTPDVTGIYQPLFTTSVFDNTNPQVILCLFYVALLAQFATPNPAESIKTFLDSYFTTNFFSHINIIACHFAFMLFYRRDIPEALDILKTLEGPIITKFAIMACFYSNNHGCIVYDISETEQIHEDNNVFGFFVRPDGNTERLRVNNENIRGPSLIKSKRLKIISPEAKLEIYPVLPIPQSVTDYEKAVFDLSQLNPSDSDLIDQIVHSLLGQGVFFVYEDDSSLGHFESDKDLHAARLLATFKLHVKMSKPKNCLFSSLEPELLLLYEPLLPASIMTAEGTLSFNNFKDVYNTASLLCSSVARPMVLDVNAEIQLPSELFDNALNGSFVPKIGIDMKLYGHCYEAFGLVLASYVCKYKKSLSIARFVLRGAFGGKILAEDFVEIDPCFANSCKSDEEIEVKIMPYINQINAIRIGVFRSVGNYVQILANHRYFTHQYMNS